MAQLTNPSYHYGCLPYAYMRVVIYDQKTSAYYPTDNLHYFGSTLVATL